VQPILAAIDVIAALRLVLAAGFADHAHGALDDFGGILGLLLHSAILSNNKASTKPRAIHLVPGEHSVFPRPSKVCRVEWRERITERLVLVCDAITAGCEIAVRVAAAGVRRGGSAAIQKYRVK
jgi:hypothetical protein